MMEIKRCTRGEYPMFMDMANDAFNYGAETAWFQQHYGHCTPYPDLARDTEIGHHLLCFMDGELAGALGAYPFRWVLAGSNGQQTVVDAFGIGQVCCRAAYRSRGVMTRLLQTAEREMKEQGYLLGYLTGDRQRYGRFGYDFGGNNVRYTLSKWRFGKRASNRCGLSVRQASFADWRGLDTAYNTLPSRVLRDERTWERQLCRENYHWYIGEQDGRQAFMAYQQPTEIVELYGHVSTAEALLIDHINRLADEQLTVHYPLQNGVPDAMGAFLHEAAEQVTVSPQGLFAVLDAKALLMAAAAIMTNRDQWDDRIKRLSPDAQMALAQRWVGYIHRPLPSFLTGTTGWEAPGAASVWISEADHI